MSTCTPSEVEIAVIGGGPSGLLTALALAELPADVVCIDPAFAAGPPEAQRAPDARTSALFLPTLQLLKQLNLWDDLVHQSAPLKTLRMLDRTRRLLSAPDLVFHAKELGAEAFGWNVPNTALVKAAFNQLKSNNNIAVMAGKLANLETGPSHATATLDDGKTVRARLVVAADGRNSRCRDLAGISSRRWRYPQVALATAISARKAAR